MSQKPWFYKCKAFIFTFKILLNFQLANSFKANNFKLQTVSEAKILSKSYCVSSTWICLKIIELFTFFVNMKLTENSKQISKKSVSKQWRLTIKCLWSCGIWKTSGSINHKSKIAIYSWMLSVQPQFYKHYCCTLL